MKEPHVIPDILLDLKDQVEIWRCIYCLTQMPCILAHLLPTDVLLENGWWMYMGFKGRANFYTVASYISFKMLFKGNWFENHIVVEKIPQKQMYNIFHMNSHVKQHVITNKFEIIVKFHLHVKYFSEINRTKQNTPFCDI